MENVKLISNYITSSSYIVSSVGEDTNYPVSRVCDGDANDLWMKTQSSASFGITVTLPTSKSIDFLAIMRHNLRGVNLNWRIGGTSRYTGAVPGVSGNAYDTSYFVLGTSYASTSIQLTFGNKADPQIAEIVVGLRRFNKHPNFPGPVPSIEPNAEVVYTRSGHRWALKKGEEKWNVEYAFTFDENDKADFDAFMSDVEYGLRPFWIQDHEGTYRWVEVVVPIQTPHVIPGSASYGIYAYYSMDMKLIEVF